jgi:hypothetical protein
MKIKCFISLGQYASIQEDVSYLESEKDKKILQSDTRRFLKQAYEQAKTKLERRREKCRVLNGFCEKMGEQEKEAYDD